MTLVSDLPGSSRRHFIGIDNVAAGRTAASLMGRFCPRAARSASSPARCICAIIATGSKAFAPPSAAEFPGIELIGPIEGHDERAETEASGAPICCKRHPDLAGLYNLGAGNAGLVAALTASGRAGKVRVIAHELSDADPRGPAIRRHRRGARPEPGWGNPRRHRRRPHPGAGRHSARSQADPIEIGIFLRDNLQLRSVIQI